MSAPGVAWRSALRISWVTLRYRLDRIPKELGLPLARLPWPARLLLSLLACVPAGRTPGPERLRRAIEALGPIFVKFGQLLSSRPDLLTPAYAASLKRLQDQVTPFGEATARATLEAALEAPLEDHFASFEATPLASASIAQVHGAVLPNGEAVVVKLRRPGIEAVIVDDLALLRQLARTLARLWPEARRLRPEEVVEDYAHTILGELDFLAEAANTSQLRRNFRASPLLYVPRVHWPLCRDNVLVLERIYATPIGDLDALRAAGTDFKVLADRGVETFFTQVFEDNFFHADMHPGNIFVDLTDPKNPSYIAIDCAIIGTLTDADQTYLARNLLAFFNQDYAEVARLHVASGWVPAHTDVAAFEAVIREVCEPLFAQPLADISFGHFLLTLFDTARAFDMTVQPQLVLLQKTLLNIEGLGRQLYPELDLWQTAKPFMERWLARQLNPFHRARLHLEPLLAAAQSLPGLPAREAARDETIRNLESRLASLQAQPPRGSSRPLVAAVLLALGAGLTAGLSPTVLGPLALIAGGLLWVLPRRHP